MHERDAIATEIDSVSGSEKNDAPDPQGIPVQSSGTNFPLTPVLSPASGEGEIGHMESSFHGGEKGQGWRLEEIEGDTKPDDGARQAAGTRQAGRADS